MSGSRFEGRFRKIVRIGSMLAAFAAFAVLAGPLAAGAATKPATGSAALRFGWIEWDPYQFEETRDRQRVVSGLDIELVRAIAAGADQKIEYELRSWAEVLEGLADGTIDVSVGYKRPERDAFVHYSFPYRLETEVILVRRGDAATWSQRDLTSLLDAMRGRFRIGIVQGYAYGPERFDAFLGDPANAPFVVSSASDRASLERLITGEVDGVAMDRTVAATIAWRNGWLDDIEELPLVINQDHVFVLFSKASTTQAQVDAFNQSMVRLRDDGGFSRIVRAYLYPILIAMTTEADWFLAIDVLGTVAFAISGLILAVRERYSVIGALVLAALPAVGGGLVRDLIVSRDPVGLVRTPLYVELILATVFAGYVLLRIGRFLDGAHERVSEISERAKRLGQHTVAFFDSLGLASFTVTGVAVAVGTNVQPLWLWGPLLAVLTAAGGGIMRDVVRGRIEESSLKASFYPEVAAFWGFALSVFLVRMGESLSAQTLFWAVLVTIAGAFLTRSVAYLRGWKPPAYG